jgi:hypothetical protein
MKRTSWPYSASTPSVPFPSISRWTAPRESFRPNFLAADATTRLALAWQAIAVDRRCLGELNRHAAHLCQIVNN